jgi:hypothetical protein
VDLGWQLGQAVRCQFVIGGLAGVRSAASGIQMPATVVTRWSFQPKTQPWQPLWSS